MDKVKAFIETTDKKILMGGAGAVVALIVVLLGAKMVLGNMGDKGVCNNIVKIYKDELDGFTKKDEERFKEDCPEDLEERAEEIEKDFDKKKVDDYKKCLKDAEKSDDLLKCDDAVNKKKAEAGDALSQLSVTKTGFNKGDSTVTVPFEIKNDGDKGIDYATLEIELKDSSGNVLQKSEFGTVAYIPPKGESVAVEVVSLDDGVDVTKVASVSVKITKFSGVVEKAVTGFETSAVTYTQDGTFSPDLKFDITNTSSDTYDNLYVYVVGYDASGNIVGGIEEFVTGDKLAPGSKHTVDESAYLGFDDVQTPASFKVFVAPSL